VAWSRDPTRMIRPSRAHTSSGPVAAGRAYPKLIPTSGTQSRGTVRAAAAPEVPEALRRQLRDGGRLVIPVGEADQELRVLTRERDAYHERRLFPVRFVPLIGGPSARTVPEPSQRGRSPGGPVP